MKKHHYYIIKGVIGGVGLMVLFKVIIPLSLTLQALPPLLAITPDTTPEFKIFLVCLAIYLNCIVINTITNIVFKIQKLLDKKVLE